MQTWVKEHKRQLAAALTVLFFLLTSWQVLSHQMARAFQESLLGRINQQLNGRFHAETVDMSMFGWIRLHQVFLYDQQGELLLQTPLIKVGYRWSDLLGRSFGINQVETVRIEEADLWLKEQDTRLNWEGLFKESVSDSSDFHGRIELLKSKVHIDTSLIAKTVENVQGVIDFAKNPDLLVNLEGKVDQATFTIAGQWGKGRPGELRAEAQKVDIAKLGVSLGDAPTKLAGGTLEKFSLVFVTDALGNVQATTQGEFTGLSTTGSVEIREGSGTFSGDRKGLYFNDLAMAIAKQQAQGSGRLEWRNGEGFLDFNLRLLDIDPGSLMDGLSLQRPLSAQVHVSGPTADPDVTGSFRVEQINFSDMNIRGVEGQFRYSKNSLWLEHGGGAANQGVLAATGEVRVSSQSYELEVEGQGMESSRLTDKDVQGRLDFSGRTIGQGQNAVTSGRFVIYNGKAFGIPFERMSGSFVKKGGSTDIADLAVQTPLGTFYPEQLTKEALERMKGRDLPVTREQLEKEVTQRIIQRFAR